MGGYENTQLLCSSVIPQKEKRRASEAGLASETVEGLALTLEGVDDVHGRHSLAAGMLGVGDRVTDDVLEEDLEDTTGLFVDETRDALHTTTTGETTDGGLGDSLDVVTKHLAMTLGATLSESLSSFSAARHVACLFVDSTKDLRVASCEEDCC